jgi:hypothetical protein
VWKTGGSPVIQDTPDQEAPAHLDYDRWLGPAPKRPYNPKRCHFSFRYFQDYSFGNYADFWCHISDIAFWALELGHPTSVVTRGELQDKGMADTPKRLDMDLEFPDLKYFWTTSRPKDAPGKVGGGIGAWFIGDKGSLVTEYNKRAVYLDGKELGDLPDVPKSVPRSPGHQRNFLDSVKSRKPTESNLPYAVTMTTPMFLGRISLLLGRPLKWDPEKQEIPGDPEATRMLGREWRKPWVPPGREA